MDNSIIAIIISHIKIIFDSMSQLFIFYCSPSGQHWNSFWLHLKTTRKVKANEWGDKTSLHIMRVMICFQIFILNDMEKMGLRLIFGFQWNFIYYLHLRPWQTWWYVFFQTVEIPRLEHLDKIICRKLHWFVKVQAHIHYSHSVLYYVWLYCASQMLYFVISCVYKLEARLSISKKILNPFIVIFALLVHSGNEPVLSLKYVCS